MKLYRLRIDPGEHDGEGEDHDEWFSSLRDAKTRRAELIRQDLCLVDSRTKREYAIDRVWFPPLPAKQLALTILNRAHHGYTKERVVSAYEGGHVEEGSRGFCRRCGHLVSYERFEKTFGEKALDEKITSEL